MKNKSSLNLIYLLLSLLIATAHSADTTKKRKGYGSGAIISDKGLIVTCAHVVKSGTNFTIYYENLKHNATLLDIIDDRGQDLAILRCPDLAGKPFFQIKPSGSLKPGDTVYDLGFPEADVLGREIKITKGEISSKTGYKNDSNIWQTSVDIHPGCSGGPFLDEWGRLVGVASSYIPEERISYCTKSQLLLDAFETYHGEMNIQSASEIPSAKEGLGAQLFYLIKDRGNVKKSMSAIRETSANKVVIVLVE